MFFLESDSETCILRAAHPGFLLIILMTCHNESDIYSTNAFILQCYVDFFKTTNISPICAQFSDI